MHRLPASWRFLHAKLDIVALFQIALPRTRNGGKMNEHIALSFSPLDKAKALVLGKPFHFAAIPGCWICHSVDFTDCPGTFEMPGKGIAERDGEPKGNQAKEQSRTDGNGRGDPQRGRHEGEGTLHHANLSGDGSDRCNRGGDNKNKEDSGGGRGIAERQEREIEPAVASHPRRINEQRNEIKTARGPARQNERAIEIVDAGVNARRVVKIAFEETAEQTIDQARDGVGNGVDPRAMKQKKNHCGGKNKRPPDHQPDGIPTKTGARTASYDNRRPGNKEKATAMRLAPSSMPSTPTKVPGAMP